MTARATFRRKELKRLLAEVERHQGGYLAGGPWDYAYTGPADHPIRSRVDQGGLAQGVRLAELPAVMKFPVAGGSDMAALAETIRALGMSVNHHLDEGIIDFAPGRTTKWEALTSLGIDEYNAFGNYINDLDLLRNARHAVRVGAHADLDGVAHVTVASAASTSSSWISRDDGDPRLRAVRPRRDGRPGAQPAAGAAPSFPRSRSRLSRPRGSDRRGSRPGRGAGACP
ncbi:hypothetical protein [Streptomyces spectabilis]|uniref:hypothetical protein n=1 Tax=Streptomyces spectabilis TaxID=68270 RepID=UPI001CEF8532|nr:hypothetical protein [Streptomyces spectabilis]